MLSWLKTITISADAVADDWVITCKSVAEACAALAAATRILERLGVRLNPQKTRATAELIQELNRTLPTRPDFKTTCQSPGYLPL
jgi:hypothetical protein